MAWHTGTSTGYRDLLTKAAGFATSQHVSAVALNAAGTGYIAGEILTVPHAGALLVASIEVLTVGGSGEVLTFKLRNMGAYSNRVATVAANAGGSGYVVGDVLEIQGGTETEKAKALVATLSGSAVATVTLFETGGAYSVAPGLTGAATIGVGPAAFAGDDAATIDITMTALVGTTAVATAGGSGTLATFDLTLTATGWDSLQNSNGYTFNSQSDEKEVALEGTVAGGLSPISLFRTYTEVDGIETRHGIAGAMCNAFNPAVSFDSQSGRFHVITPVTSSGSYLCVFDVSMTFWFQMEDRYIHIWAKCVGGSITSYNNLFTDALNPAGTQTENPVPFYVQGSSAGHDTNPDDGGFEQTGPSELIEPSGKTGPAFFWRITDQTSQVVKNSDHGTVSKVHVMYPIGEPNKVTGGSDPNNIAMNGAFTLFNGIALNTGGTATKKLIPTKDSGDDIPLLFPLVLVRSPTTSNDVNTDLQGEVADVYWISGTKEDGSVVSSEDTTVDAAGQRYILLPNAHRSERYSFVAVKEA